MKILLSVFLLLSLVYSQTITPNFWVDLTTSTAYVATGQSVFGGAGKLSISFQYYSTNTNGGRYFFHTYNTLDKTPDPMSINAYFQSGQFYINIGGGTTVGLGSGFSFNANLEYAITFDLVGSSTGVTVTLWINGAQIDSKLISKAVIGAGPRITTLLGAFYDRSTGIIRTGGYGSMDNFIIMNDVSDANFRTLLMASGAWTPPQSIWNNVALWLGFDDTVNGAGNQTAAITQFAGPESVWVSAYFYGGAIFQYHAKVSTPTCSSNGDPHLYAWTFGTTYNNVYFTWAMQMSGHKLFMGCDEADYEIRTYTRYTPWWGATVYRAIGMRYKQTVIRWSLDETDRSTYSSGDLLQLPPGAVYKLNILDTAWIPLPVATTYTPIGYDGLFYQYPNIWNMWITVPGLSTFNLQSPDGRYTNIQITFNFADSRCIRNTTTGTGRKGQCDGESIDRHVYFLDWVIPNPIPDIPVPQDPCAGLPAQTVSDITGKCKELYPTSTDLYSSCLVDTCLSGDTELIPLTTPTPECLILALQGKQSSQCPTLTCPNSCSHRGNCTNGACVCNNGWVGNDCGQSSSFGCYEVSYGSITTIVNPLQVLNTADGKAFNKQLTAVGVDRSVLFYSVLAGGVKKLFVVSNDIGSLNGGSYKMCFSQAITLESNTNNAKVTPGANNCFDVSYGAFGIAGLIFTTPTVSTTYTLSFSNLNNVDQILYGSGTNGKYLDIAKIPSKYFSSFTLKIQDCDATTCAANNGNCAQCMANTNCGYCLETSRCMPGGPQGPKQGICQNWRYSYGVSRVVHVDYNGADLVAPDYEVFLSNVANDAVPVSLLVPTGLGNYVFDVVVVLQTTGSYPVYGGSIKNNLVNAIMNIYAASKNIRVAIGNYNQLKPNFILPCTQPVPSYKYLFANALESPTGTGKDLQGGQLRAYFEAAGGTGTSQNFLKNSKKIVVITVYDIPTSTEETNYLLNARQTLIDKNILPVFVVDSTADSSVITYYKNLANKLNGLPALVLTFNPSGDNIQQVLTRILTFSQSYPFLTANSNTDNNHIDFTTLNANSDALNIYGLITTGTRAKFFVPMLKGSDNTHHKAVVTVPGFGSATIEDVDAGYPTARSTDVVGKEDAPCIPITLYGITFQNLLPPLFVVNSIVTKGSLTTYDTTKPNFVGTNIVQNVPFSSGSLCYIPPAHKSSWPADAAYDQFTFYVTDGCVNSDTVTVKITVTPVYHPPMSNDISIDVYEGTATANLNIVGTEWDNNLNTIPAPETVTITFGSTPTADFNAIYNDNPVLTNIFQINSATVNGQTFGPYHPDPNNYTFSQIVSYNEPSVNFFGVVSIPFTLVDEQKLQNQYTMKVNVIGVNDPPVTIPKKSPSFEILTNENTNANFVLSGTDIDNRGLTLFFRINSIQGTGAIQLNGNNVNLTVNQQYQCLGDANSFKVACQLTLIPGFLESNCPENSTNTALCTGTYADVDFWVVDNNNLWRTSSLDASVKSAQSPVQKVVIDVVKIDYRPATPANINVTINEDTFTSITLQTSDIDTPANSLSTVIAFLPDPILKVYTTNTDGSRGAVVDKDFYTLNNDAKKRWQWSYQNSTIQVVPGANLFGSHRDNGFFFTSFLYYSYDSELVSDSATVTINVRPINDAPVPNPTTATFAEDNTYIVSFAAKDVDNLESELTYTITQLPPTDALTGVSLFVINSDGSIGTEIMSTPYVVQRVNGVAQVQLVPRKDWFGTVTLKYTVTDKDNYLFNGEPGYVVNVVPQDLSITVTPVNDAPRLLVSNPSGFEDTPIVITLAGVNDAWGEQDTLQSVVLSVVYDGKTNTSVNLGTLYQYTDALFNALSNSITATTGGEVITAGSAVKDSNSRIIYVPFQNKNSESTVSFLMMTPYINYLVREIVSSTEPKNLQSPTGLTGIRVASVNDAPVCYNNPWSVSSVYDSNYGIPGGVWKVPTDGCCFEDCVYFEDFGSYYPNTPSPRPICFGGQDVELSDLQVRIESITCPPNVELNYIDENGLPNPVFAATLPGTVLSRSVVSGALHPMLTFRTPADDFNLDNPAENRNGRLPDGGHRGPYYCQIKYNVIDQDGAVSANSKTININVLQVNDYPRERFGGSDRTGDLNAVDMYTTNLYGLEDYGLAFQIDAFDVEGDDYVPRILSCIQRGTFYFPTANQYQNIDANTGVLTIPQDNPWLLWDQTNPVVCPKNKDVGPVFPTKFSQTQKRGWYLLFVPAPADSDQRIYNTIDIYYDDSISPINTTYASSRTIRIDPVNDAPVISVTSGLNGDTLTKLSYDKDVFLVDPTNYNGPDIHVDGSASISAVVNTQTFLPINVFDEESGSNDRLAVSITLSSKNKGTLTYKTARGETVILGTNGNYKQLDVPLSLTEMKTFFGNQLKFLATEQGTFTVTITVNDTGAYPGTCEPGNPNFQASLKTKYCPRISKAILTIIAQNNASLVTGAAVGVGAGVLALAAVGALLGGKFLKPKETDAWTEWDEDKLGDVALKNPFYQQETNVKASGIFQGK